MRTAKELQQFKLAMKGVKITHPEHVFRKRLESAGIEHICQCIVGFYIVDFAIPSRALVIELDGASHDHRGDYDKRRDDFLRAWGLSVLRLTNREAARYDLARLADYPERPRAFRSALSQGNVARGLAIQRARKKAEGQMELRPSGC